MTLPCPTPPRRSRTLAVLAAGATALLVAPVPSGASPATVRRCGTIAVPGTEAHAAIALRGATLPCRSVQRIVRAAYSRTVLVGTTRVTVRDAGRRFRCTYTPHDGGMVCEGRGRRLRGTI